MYFHPDITIKRKYADAHEINRTSVSQNFAPAERETISTVPFMKNNEFDYGKILFWMDEESQKYLGFILGFFLDKKADRKFRKSKQTPSTPEER